LDVPFISSGSEVESSPHSPHLLMPSLDFNAPDEADPNPSLRRRRRSAILRTFEKSEATTAGTGEEEPWYMYLPTILGVGTAILAVGFVGAIGLQSWRRNQSS
jgi:thiamine pyrophosphokinase